MPSKPKAPNGRQALYVVQRPDLEDLKKRGQEYAHPRVQVGHRYGDRGDDYFYSDFTVQFQVTLNPDEKGHLTNDGHAYAGSVELSLNQVVEASKAIARVQAKARALAPDQQDEFQWFIVGLRGCGYKEAVMANDRSHIAFIR